MELNLSLNLDVRLLLLWVLIILFLCLLRVHSKEMLASAVAAYSAGAPGYSFFSVFEEEGEQDVPICRLVAAIVCDTALHANFV